MRPHSLRTSCWVIAASTHTTNPGPTFWTLPAPVPHIEGGVPLGYGRDSAKTARCVKFDGSSAVLLKHDVGNGIPHMGPPSPLLLAHMATSKCQVMFGKATVKVEGQQAGWWLPGIAMFQVCANPVPVPTGFNLGVFRTTVTFGFSWGDLVCGHVRICVDMVFTELVNSVFKFPRVKRIFDAWAKRIAHRLASTLGPVMIRTVGPYAVRVTEQVLKKLPSRVAKRFVVTPLYDKLVEWQSGEDIEGVLEVLSPAIDEALADMPPPESLAQTLGQTAVSYLLDPISLLE